MGVSNRFKQFKSIKPFDNPPGIKSATKSVPFLAFPGENNDGRVRLK
jgi:hypothetical protein